MQFYTKTERLKYQDALPLFKKLRGLGPSCLFESSSVNDKSGRMSVLTVDPTLELKGKGDTCFVKLIDERAQYFYDVVKEHFASYKKHERNGELELHIPKEKFRQSEDERPERQNIAQVIRELLASCHFDDKNFMGLYGALAYTFIYLFEDVPATKENDTLDFHLFLNDTVFLFNHLTLDLTLYCTRQSEKEAAEAIEHLMEEIKVRSGDYETSLELSNVKVVPDDETFKQQVAEGVDLCMKGELLEIVLGRKLTADVKGDPLKIYEVYKQINPSPYMFYFDFGDECLLGASPELMLRYEDDKAVLRPISGSIRRGKDPIEDHHLMMELLNSPKENSELDMLIDLGRNDLSKICKPGVEVEHYRIIEKYSHVTHTVSQVSGVLQDRYTGFDALVSSLNAGTLTGAPKFAAMSYIEQIERHPRGYYGGTIGYFLFNGDVNTAITIRTAHVKNDQLSFLAGATILYESIPENELKETLIKSGAFLAAIKNYTKDYEKVYENLNGR